MGYMAYFYKDGKTKNDVELYGTEKEVFAHARLLAKGHSVEGYAVYKDNMLVGDWTLKSGRYISNMPRKKKKTSKTWHPFGL